MKLYTEEQVKTAILQTFLVCKITIHERYKNCENCECDILETLKPIELPSNEEIGIQLGAEASDFPTYELADEYIDGFDNGAKWVMEQIKQKSIGH